MPPKDVRPLVDRVLGGRLDDLLGRWRDEGLTNPQIASRLQQEHDIDVSPETVRRWLDDLPAAASGST